MRFLLFALLLLATPALAQISTAPAPTAAAAAPQVDPFTVTGVAIDVPVSDPQSARDTALLAAERQAFQKLKAQLAAGDPSAANMAEPSDSQLAHMVQNFAVSGEKVSAKRYVGSFTVRFRPNVVGHGVAAESAEAAAATPEATANASLTATYRFASLADWTATQQRLRASGAVKDTELQAIGRGYVKVALHYAGTPDALNHALAAQGLSLSQAADGWTLAEQGNGDAL